jgi:alpha-D-ribose 1-methylphosphonate 5-triphosphate synthase subunit PhnL
MAQLLQIEALSKSFTMHILDDKCISALSDIDLNLDEGEIVGLTGPSGSGKSTLMKCIYRTYLPTQGRVLYHSLRYGCIDLVRCSDQEILRLRREEITYCSQFLSVIPRVPAVDIVAGQLVLRGADRESARERALHYFERFNLPKELWDAYPSTFSGGEQQRINIARALVARPRFLLVDEPTASLDAQTRDAVVEAILELRNAGTGVICITHDAQTLENLADRVFQMQTRNFADAAA